MKFKGKAMVIAVALLAIEGPGVSAHSRHNGEQQVHQAAWSPQPYDSRSPLPPGYTGLNIKKVRDFLKSKQETLKKGEYETTAEYQQRIASSAGDLAPLNASSEYAFLLQLEMTPTYNADTQTYTVWKPIWCHETMDYGPNKGWFTCVVGKISRQESHYVGSNAFGVKATIDKTTGIDFGIAVPKDTDIFKSDIFSHGPFSRNAPMHELKANFHVPLTEARTLKGATIGVLLVGRFNSARLIQGYPTQLSPTIDAPYDEFVTQDAVPFTPTKLVLYVVQTGQVLGVQAL
jgi:hypothetical protein